MPRPTSPRAVRHAGTRWRAAAAVALFLGALTAGSVAAAQADLRLIAAVKEARRPQVEALLTAGVDVNAAQADGATALHWAVYADDEPLVERLLRAGAKAGMANEYGVTALALACSNRSDALVRRLLAAGADPKAALVETGETVLMTCARSGSAGAVEALLAKGADVNARESVEGQTALMWAVSQRHATVTRLLLMHGADLHARSRAVPWMVSRRFQGDLKFGEQPTKYGTDVVETKRGGYTALLFAARVGDLESARLLLEAGADVDDRSPDGTSALVLAAHGANGAVARHLLDTGADPNQAGAGYTALHAAVMTGDRALLDALLARNANVNPRLWQGTPVSRNGQVLGLGEALLGVTPFALAAKFAEVEMMRALLAQGAEPDAPSETVGCVVRVGDCRLTGAWTPLMLAAGASWKGGSFDRRDRAALFPEVFLDHANEPATLAAVTLLLEQKVDVTAQDATGNTALHHAVTTGFASVIERLVRAGARLDARNAAGQTPLALASGGRRRDGAVGALEPVAALLRRLGADE